MQTKTLVATLLFVASLCFVAIHDAYAAKRFGGGRSFGSKPAMQRSTTAPKQQQPGVTQNATAASTASKKSGMAGIFGGLLAGTLLGSLLFGDGDGGGGIFSLLMMGLLLFGAYKVFMYMRSKNSPQTAGGPQYAQQGAPQDMGQNMHYQSAQNSSAGWGSNLQGGAAAPSHIPAGFQVEEFLEGAKMAFSRMQSSWDKRDLDDIALFTSPTVFEEVKKQLAEDDSPSKTDVLLNNARLLSVTTENDEETATVYFDVILRETQATETTQVREVWHFARPISGGNWKIDGIQQVDD